MGTGRRGRRESDEGRGGIVDLSSSRDGVNTGGPAWRGGRFDGVAGRGSLGTVDDVVGRCAHHHHSIN